MFNDIANFSFPTTTMFGSGALRKLPWYLSELKIRKPLIVTDNGFISTNSFKHTEKVLNTDRINYRIFSEVSPNPLDQDIEKGVSFYKNEGCDGLIGLGGGSSMDAAKALSAMVTNEGTVADFDAATGGNMNIKGPLPPLIAIPTTSGTGSEVGRCAVISSKEDGRKFMVCHPLMMPDLAILDPDLTLELPPLLTAATGMDAFSHCLESLVSPVFHPLCDAIAVKGIELISQYLECAFNNPMDIEARGYMQLASMMGAVAFQKDLGATHSVAHALSAVCHIHHGLANAICMVPVMKFNLETSTKQYSQVAKAFGINTFSITALEASEKAIEYVRGLIERLKLPLKLRDVGVNESHLTELSQKAFLDPCHKTNPRSCSENDLFKILKEAL